jgi:hypothetical protein
MLGLIAAFVGDDESGFSPRDCSYDPFDMRADIIIYNGGADVIGPPGTGKSTLLKNVDKQWRRLYPDDVVVNTAITYVASRLLPRGQTLARLFHKGRYGNVRHTVVQLDESRTVGMAALGRLASWGFVGAKFVLYGDDCQFEPIKDAYHGDGTPGIYQQMTGNLRVELSKNRRGLDPVLFDFHYGLRAHVRNPAMLKETCRRLLDLYPWDGELPDWGFLCLSHKTRVQVNAVVNAAVAKAPGAVFVKKVGTIRGLANQPQGMWLVPGVELIGASKASTTIVNGYRYVVEAVTTAVVTVRVAPEYRREMEPLAEDATPEQARAHVAERKRLDKAEGPITLSHKDASEMLRLTHCLCYATVQGITIRDKKVVLLDVMRGHFGIRTVLVAVSRVTDGRFVGAATAKQQADLVKDYVAEAEGPEIDGAATDEEADSEEE